MTIPLIFAFAGLLALFLVVLLAKGHLSTNDSLDELASRLRSVDVEAFRNLIDENEEQFLREKLPPREFRRIQRRRNLAAVDYIWCAAQNAAILTRLGEAARQNSDPAIAAAAEKLVGNALRLRLYAFQAIPRLYVTAVVPWAHASPNFVADTYDSMTRQVVMLGCLHYPTRGMSSAL
jgi:hypothetical protein